MDVVHEYSDLTVHLTLFNAAIAEGIPRKPYFRRVTPPPRNRKEKDYA